MNPSTPCRLINTPGKKKKKWYAVTVGRQTGVFDDWYYAPFFCGVSFLMRLVRIYTNSLVIGVSGNNYLSFSTYDEAQVYYTTNRKGRMVVRTSEQDEATFGSLEEADDVNWRGY
jgi:hypothetical protein